MKKEILKKSDNNKRLSVIMPVYNTGKYLKESIDSIIEQTYPYFELICVDDASDDQETKDILTFYEKEDERIKVIWRKENKGAAEARNYGATYATCEYIIFVDSDDRFSPFFFEVMIASMDKSNADVCICGHSVFGEDDIKTVRPIEIKGVTDRVFRLNELGEKGLTFWWNVPWNKIYRKSFIDKKKIYYQALTTCDDEYFACASVLNADKIVYADNLNPLVYYRKGRSGQLSSQNNIVNVFLFYEKLITDYWEKVSEVGKRQIMYRLLIGGAYLLKESANNPLAEEMYYKVKHILYNLDDSIPKGELSRKLYQYYTCFSNNEYEDGWILLIGDYYAQLIGTSNKIIKLISSYDSIIIWGDGQRGKALQKLLFNNRFSNVTVIERTVKGEYINEYGYLVKALFSNKNGQIVIASNSDIYNEICWSEQIDGSIIDLEEYCPL